MMHIHDAQGNRIDIPPELEHLLRVIARSVVAQARDAQREQADSRVVQLPDPQTQSHAA